MNQDQGYDAWRRRGREHVEAPPGFSDRVMGAVETHSAESGWAGRSLAGRLLAALLASRLSRIGLCSLAAATCAFRLWHVVAILVAQ
jgi:hypothetical protein